MTYDIRMQASAPARVSAYLIIGKLLGHAQATTTARYAHLDVDPLRRASEQIGSRLAAAMGEGDDGPTSAVVSLNRRATT